VCCGASAWVFRIIANIERACGSPSIVKSALKILCRQCSLLACANIISSTSVGARPSSLNELVQVGELVVGKRQAELAVAPGPGPRPGRDVDADERLAGCSSNRWATASRVGEHALGHAVVQQRREGLALGRVERLRTAEQAALQLDPDLGDALDPVHREAAVAGDVGRLRRPRRDRAEARRDDQAGVGAPASTNGSP
jgi:hypothetical protein